VIGTPSGNRAEHAFEPPPQTIPLGLLTTVPWPLTATWRFAARCVKSARTVVGRSTATMHLGAEPTQLWSQRSNEKCRAGLAVYDTTVPRS
jgi:hypothetical protein